jgi:hypothetical protein
VASDVAIVNAALAKLGQRPILSLTDNTPSGRLAGGTYADIRDEMLREHPWNFATRRTTLPAEATTPAWGFARSFVLPTNWLRMLEIDNPGDFPWKLEGGKILTDLPAPISITYIIRVTDPDQMDPSFRDTLASRLAMEWCERLTGSNSLAQMMAQSYKEKLRYARSFDGQEGGTDPVARYSWIEARFTGW